MKQEILQEIADRYQTPVFVLDVGRLQSNFLRLKNFLAVRRGNCLVAYSGMVHGWSKHLDNLLSLPPDRQIRRCLAMFYGAGSGDSARAMTILRYPVNHAHIPIKRITYLWFASS